MNVCGVTRKVIVNPIGAVVALGRARNIWSQGTNAPAVGWNQCPVRNREG